MKITAVKRQAKRTDRYSIYVDGVYQFSLNESQLVESGLHSGQELDAAGIARYKETSATGKLFDRILNLLSIRPRSVWEVETYAHRKDASPEQIEYIVERCRKLGYLDDEQFARQWIENRRLTRPTSQRKLRSELLAKRIAPAVVDRALVHDHSQTNETEVLATLVAKKRSRYSDDTKFMQYLARQGFSYNDIRSVLQKD